MSRIGLSPIKIEKDLKVDVSSGNKITIKGAKNIRSFQLPPALFAKIQDGQLFLNRKDDKDKTRSFHGLYRSLIQNAIIGETKGWSKKLELNGVGYRASVSGQKLTLNLGYSHPIEMKIPDDIKMQVTKNTVLLIQGPDKEVVGRVATRIRAYRPPEPFLGKGIKYEGERLFRKAGKSAVKGGGKS